MSALEDEVGGFLDTLSPSTPSAAPQSTPSASGIKTSKLNAHAAGAPAPIPAQPDNFDDESGATYLPAADAAPAVSAAQATPALSVSADAAVNHPAFSQSFAQLSKQNPGYLNYPSNFANALLNSPQVQQIGSNFGAFGDRVLDAVHPTPENAAAVAQRQADYNAFINSPYNNNWYKAGNMLADMGAGIGATALASRALPVLAPGLAVSAPELLASASALQRARAAAGAAMNVIPTAAQVTGGALTGALAAAPDSGENMLAGAGYGAMANALLNPVAAGIGQLVVPPVTAGVAAAYKAAKALMGAGVAVDPRLIAQSAAVRAGATMPSADPVYEQSLLNSFRKSVGLSPTTSGAPLTADDAVMAQQAAGKKMSEIGDQFRIGPNTAINGQPVIDQLHNIQQQAAKLGNDSTSKVIQARIGRVIKAATAAEKNGTEFNPSDLLSYDNDPKFLNALYGTGNEISGPQAQVAARIHALGKDLIPFSLPTNKISGEALPDLAENYYTAANQYGAATALGRALKANPQGAADITDLTNRIVSATKDAPPSALQTTAQQAQVYHNLAANLAGQSAPVPQGFTNSLLTSVPGMAVGGLIGSSIGHPELGMAAGAVLPHVLADTVGKAALATGRAVTNAAPKAGAFFARNSLLDSGRVLPAYVQGAANTIPYMAAANPDYAYNKLIGK